MKYIAFFAFLCLFLMMGCTAKDIDGDDTNPGNNYNITNSSGNISITNNSVDEKETGEETNVAEPNDDLPTSNQSITSNVTIGNAKNSTEGNGSLVEDDGNDDEVIIPDWAFTAENQQDQEKCFKEAGLNTKCESGAEMPCIGSPNLKLDDKTLTLKLQNNAGSDIEITNVIWFIEDAPRDCMTENFVELAEISIGGSSFTPIDQQPTVVRDQTFYIRMKLSDLSDGYVNQGFDINYIESGSSSSDYLFSYTKVVAQGE